MISDYMLKKVLEKTKQTLSAVKFDEIKIFIDTNDILPDYITLK